MSAIKLPEPPIHFVTGKLAEPLVRKVVERLSQEHHFAYSIQVLPITVAALMTAKWLVRHVRVPSHCKTLIVPGYVADDVQWIGEQLGVSTISGPKDVHELPILFGGKMTKERELDSFNIRIMAEVNHVPRLTLDELRSLAKEYVSAGADWIDLGMTPGQTWLGVGEAVRALIDDGWNISIDSFNADEVEAAVQAGAKMVLSVHRGTLDRAADWNAELVLVPEPGRDWKKSLMESVEVLSARQQAFRMDPILEPIGCRFTASLQRYWETRQLFPDAPMLMGIGNLTELSDVDSAGVNFLLLGICEELQIDHVLTTQVIPWAQSSIRECDIARRLVHYAVQQEVPPKRLDNRLVMLRDPKLSQIDSDWLAQLAGNIKDHNFRIFVAANEIHLIGPNLHLNGTDPFALMAELISSEQGKTIDSSHAFYLGFELHKALTALTLGKQYTQDESLRWGMLTREERHHRLPRGKRSDLH